MRGLAADQASIAEKKRRIMEVGFGLFAERGIEAVTLREIMSISGVSNTSRFRYFPKKLDLVIAIGTWTWKEYIDRYIATLPAAALEGMTGAAHFGWYLDSFIDLYRHHGDMLRFNYAFNSYVQGSGAMPEQMRPYLDVVELLRSPFHTVYEKGMRDGTINRHIPEAEMLSMSFHIMLAAVTRYAVGLVYDASEQGVNPEGELLRLKEMMLREFTREAPQGSH